ncbi:MAG: aminopeptidase P family protein [Planctomycetes bacterium]|nr:aminopeptidase P family protein [Planctomycetota bacterium]
MVLRGPDTVRIQRIREALSRRKIDAVIARMPENILYLSGYLPSLGGVAGAVFTARGEVAVLAAKEDAIFLEDAWPAEVRHYPLFCLHAKETPADRLRLFLEEMSRRWGFAAGRVAFEKTFGSLSSPMFCGLIPIPAVGLFEKEIRAGLPKARLVDGTPMIQELRAVKTPYELERMRRTAEVAAMGNRAMKEHLRPGITEAELAGTIEAAIMAGGANYRGARRHRGWSFLASGPRTATGWNVFEFNTTRRLKKGDLVMNEMHTMVDGYWSDLTRTYAVGKPSRKSVEVCQVVQLAQEAAMAADRPGATGQEIDAAARSLIQEAGYGELFPHHTGHGTGLCSHEPPFIRPDVSGVVVHEGSCHSCEPAIYGGPLGFGIRIEDIVETTASGAKFLCEHERDL